MSRGTIRAAVRRGTRQLGDFAVLVHGGWRPRAALWCNALSGLTFLAGGLVAYAASKVVGVSWLVLLAAGNFLYIGASDLVPEVNKSQSLGANLLHFVSFAAGLGLLLAVASLGAHAARH